MATSACVTYDRVMEPEKSKGVARGLRTVEIVALVSLLVWLLVLLLFSVTGWTERFLAGDAPVWILALVAVGGIAAILAPVLGAYSWLTRSRG